MGTSRGSGGSHLAVDETVWANEAEGEEEVLAEFADETTLKTNERTPLDVAANNAEQYRRIAGVAPEPEPATIPVGALRILSPRTPIREVIRTVLIGCLSAMALGASFAIGFGYVWSDLSIGPAPDATRSVPAGLSPRPPSQLPARAEPRADGSARTTASPRDSARAAAGTGSDSSAALERSPRSEVLPSAGDAARNEDLPEGRKAPASAAATPDPGPAFGVPLEKPPSNAAGSNAPAPAALRSNESPLTARPIVAAPNAVVPQTVSPVLPSPPSAASFREASHTGEAAAAAPRRSEVDAVREAIGRYQTAYSRKDLGAMALVWPSIDVAGVARAFENVDRQALTFNDCHVTMAGRFATAVCPGQVRYVGRVGGRQLQERHGTWTIALERNGELWQFTRLNVR